MRITGITLPTRDIDATEHYYRARLGLPVRRTAGGVAVTVGPSRLIFRPGDYSGSHHLAFTIPTGSFPEAKEWLGAQVPLLTRDGADQFELDGEWNSCSVYFEGPDKQVLELIERRDLRNQSREVFGPDSLLCVSEIGVAVPDVLRTAEQLQSAGAQPYGGQPSPGFAAVGDGDGLIILVAAGRAWMPTDDRSAEHTPVTIRLEGVQPTRITDDQIITE